MSKLFKLCEDLILGLSTAAFSLHALMPSCGCLMYVYIYNIETPLHLLCTRIVSVCTNEAILYNIIYTEFMPCCQECNFHIV